MLKVLPGAWGSAGSTTGGGKITIKDTDAGTTINITGAKVTLGEATTIDGVPFLTHVHYNVAETATATGKVVTATS